MQTWTLVTIADAWTSIKTLGYNGMPFHSPRVFVSPTSIMTSRRYVFSVSLEPCHDV